MWRNVNGHFDVSGGTVVTTRLHKFASLIVGARAAVRAFVRSLLLRQPCVRFNDNIAISPLTQTNRRAVLATLTRHWRGDVLIGTRNASIAPRVVCHPPSPLPLTVYTTAVCCNREYWILSASVFRTCMHSPRSSFIYSGKEKRKWSWMGGKEREDAPLLVRTCS